MKEALFESLCPCRGAAASNSGSNTRPARRRLRLAATRENHPHQAPGSVAAIVFAVMLFVATHMQSCIRPRTCGRYITAFRRTHKKPWRPTATQRHLCQQKLTGSYINIMCSYRFASHSPLPRSCRACSRTGLSYRHIMLSSQHCRNKKIIHPHRAALQLFFC